MKVLVATTYIYNREWDEFSKNTTGFGIMVRNICESVGKISDLEFISYALTKGREGWVRKHEIGQVMLYSRPKDWLTGLKSFVKYRQPLVNRIRFVYYCVNKGYVRRTIKKFKPDIVHIHGIGYATKPYIDVCIEMNIPFMVTLHGLIGLDESIKVAQFEKDYEKEFLIDAYNYNYPVAVISSGIKKRIEKYYIGDDARNVKVVLNGTDIATSNSDMDLDVLKPIEKAKKENKKICVYIGNISDNKNQIEAVKYIERIRESCLLVLVGREDDAGKTRQYINDHNLNDKVLMTGFCQCVDKILELSDLNLFFSKNDGFGLSIIEAFSFGVPTILYDDLDVVDDIYDDKCVELLNRNNFDTNIKLVEESIDKKWDREYIKGFSRHFTLEKMARNYLEVYKDAVKDKTK